MCLSGNFCLSRAMNPQRGEVPHILKTCTRKISRAGVKRNETTTTNTVADICYGANENIMRNQLLAITEFKSGWVVGGV